MQLVLERSSIDEPLTFDIGLMQLNFHTSVFTHAKVFSNPNVTTFQSNCAEGLHFIFLCAGILMRVYIRNIKINLFVLQIMRNKKFINFI